MWLRIGCIWLVLYMFLMFCFRKVMCFRFMFVLMFFCGSLLMMLNLVLLWMFLMKFCMNMRF